MSAAHDALTGSGLSQNQLAKRLKCDTRRLQQRRDNAAELAEWTKTRDPQSIAWEFRMGEYYPVHDA